MSLINGTKPYNTSMKLSLSALVFECVYLGLGSGMSLTTSIVQHAENKTSST